MCPTKNTAQFEISLASAQKGGRVIFEAIQNKVDISLKWHSKIAKAVTSHISCS